MEQVSNTIEKIKTGLTGKPMKTSLAEMQSTGQYRLQKPPMVIPDKVPTQIMAESLGCTGYGLKDDPTYQVIADHIWSFQHSHSGWDNFAIKIDGGLRKTMAGIFKDCRQNGFFSPRCIFEGKKKKIIFGQLVDKDRKIPLPDEIKLDLCTLCESKQCYGIDKAGNPKQNKENCWR